MMIETMIEKNGLRLGRLYDDTIRQHDYFKINGEKIKIYVSHKHKESNVEVLETDYGYFILSNKWYGWSGLFEKMYYCVDCSCPEEAREYSLTFKYDFTNSTPKELMSVIS